MDPIISGILKYLEPEEYLENLVKEGEYGAYLKSQRLLDHSLQMQVGYVYNDELRPLFNRLARSAEEVNQHLEFGGKIYILSRKTWTIRNTRPLEVIIGYLDAERTFIEEAYFIERGYGQGVYRMVEHPLTGRDFRFVESNRYAKSFDSDGFLIHGGIYYWAPDKWLDSWFFLECRDFGRVEAILRRFAGLTS